MTLVVNDVEVSTQKAAHHAVVFENVALNDGANTITAKAGAVEDTITLNGVAEHNEEYTLPDSAAAMAVGNWFDDVADNDESEEIEVIDGYYSVNDIMADLIANEETQKVFKGWLMKNGNLTMASMLGAIAGMMGQARLVDMFANASAMMGDVSQKDIAQINRLLNKIKK